MKTCPLLWRQNSPARSGLLEKTVDLDCVETGSDTVKVEDGLFRECLGESCRFYTPDAACGLEKQLTLAEQQETNLREHQETLVNKLATLAGMEHRLDLTDERLENILLTLVELTERLERVLTCLSEPTATAENPSSSEVSSQNQAAAREYNSDGIAFYHAGDLEQAAACFQQAIDKNPGLVEAYNNLGLVETEQGKKEQAVAHFEQAIQLDPELSASYTNLGYVYFMEESYLEAIGMYEEALKRSSESSTAWTNLGNAHFKLGNVEQAREAWEKAISLDPANTKAAKNLAQVAQEEPL